MAFVKRNSERAEMAKAIQGMAGLRGLEPGNIVIIHIPFQKTKLLFRKRRRNFGELAEF
jgi:hypothetical protein